MARRSKTGNKASNTDARKASPARDRKNVKAKRRIASKPGKGRSVAELEAQLERQAGELDEARHQQIATADVLKVISRSAFDLEQALIAICETAARLCQADQVAIFTREGDLYRFAASFGFPPEYAADWGAAGPRAIDPNSPLPGARSVAERRPVHVLDLAADPAFHQTASRGSKARTALGIPLLRDGEPIGNFILGRRRVEAFSDRQIELLQTFADQAVIAIENARLFNETKESLERQTATSEVLEVISSSPGDLESVFKSMLNNALRICEAKFGQLLLFDGTGFLPAELHNTPAEYAKLFKSGRLVPAPTTGLGRLIASKKVIHIPDVMSGRLYAEGDPLRVATIEILQARTLLAVPMLKDAELVGAIVIYRQEVRPFSDQQIKLVTNFGAQAVIAIENTRLLNELRRRTADLSKSLDDLRTAQDRLIQTEKLASLGQLTAGIAHEIKNPLNFVNNFSALSVELTGELRDVLKQEALTDEGRGELDELTGLLQDNLSKVVQHGKRADSIVKNMLLHSREGSGERRSAEINRLVEESLSLAYHGARAEKPGFAITLKHDLDPDAGALELYPQEITRALLNLISNGFYAATKRKAEAENGDFEPVLSAATRNLGETVEIRIRDNGTGIPRDVREKMFNPFFTTKPTGEGTGLGLSMTHDIVVKQHGGRIDVVTEPGTFTEFIVTLPRGNGNTGGL
jgi:signal transduction histidine kinase